MWPHYNCIFVFFTITTTWWHSAYISDDFQKKTYKFPFSSFHGFFSLIVPQKVGGTNDSPSPPLKKVGETVSPVSPPSYAHAWHKTDVSRTFQRTVKPPFPPFPLPLPLKIAPSKIPHSSSRIFSNNLESNTYRH